jgi:hypothetical protein
MLLVACEQLETLESAADSTARAFRSLGNCARSLRALAEGANAPALRPRYARAMPTPEVHFSDTDRARARAELRRRGLLRPNQP